uniref:Uncharacterized protein n=1 Tax=Astatotilapia calliptera TaxID=8154 RepID=A0AAX7UMM0_ASTCA
MVWFHCNQCFKRRGSTFAASSCGHIFCEACVKSNPCTVCGASCSYLAINEVGESDVIRAAYCLTSIQTSNILCHVDVFLLQMKPQEKMFFNDPVKLIQSRLEHMCQIVIFQQMQMERVMAQFKHKSAELERRLKEVTEQSYRQLSDLQRENADLKKQLLEVKKETMEFKKPLSQWRLSPGQFQTEGTQRMSLPVAVTSPVTPRSRTMSHIGSAESQRWNMHRGPSLSLNSPGSAASVSSHSSLHEYRTPTSLSTPTRTQTPGLLQFISGLSVQSPRH